MCVEGTQTDYLYNYLERVKKRSQDHPRSFNEKSGY